MPSGNPRSAVDPVVERRRAVALARHYREAERLSIAQIAERVGRSRRRSKPTYTTRRARRHGRSRRATGASVVAVERRPARATARATPTPTATAPRGALSYPRRSREELEGMFGSPLRLGVTRAGQSPECPAPSRVLGDSSDLEGCAPLERLLPCPFRPPSMAGGRRPLAATSLHHKHRGGSTGEADRKPPCSGGTNRRVPTHVAVEPRASCAGPRCQARATRPASGATAGVVSPASHPQMTRSPGCSWVQWLTRIRKVKDVMSSPSDRERAGLLSSSADDCRAGCSTVEREEALSEHRNGT